MRVIVVSSHLPARGLSDRPPDAWLTTRALQTRCESVLIGPVPWAPRLPFKTPWDGYRSIPRCEVVEGVTIRHPRYLVVPKMARGLQGCSYAAQLERELTAISKSFVPDAIFATWAYPDVYAAVRVGAKRGLPVVGKVIGSDVNLLPQLGMRREVQFALRHADRVVGICEDLCSKAIALGATPERCVVVKNGLDLHHFPMRARNQCRAELAIPLDVELMLYVGNLRHVKGPDILMTAFARVAHERPAARLAMVGDGPLLAALTAQAQALGVGDRVHFLGRRPHTEVGIWMNAADLLVLPSRSEGLPNVVTESLACGTPVVATRVGGVPEAFQAGVAGVLVEPEDSAAFANAIVALLERPFTRETVRSTLQERSWDAVADDLLQVIGDAVQERRRGAVAAGPVRP
jgi:glycosyltransferase involved in cell wall biosynthesis